jgi:hypothetical protein
LRNVAQDSVASARAALLISCESSKEQSDHPPLVTWAILGECGTSGESPRETVEKIVGCHKGNQWLVLLFLNVQQTAVALPEHERTRKSRL